MITEQDIEQCVNYLVNEAKDAAVVRAERHYLEGYGKSLLAVLASESNASTEAAKQRDALKHPKYLEHLEKLREVVIKDEMNRGLRHAAEMKIEAWRTMESSRRSVKL